MVAADSVTMQYLLEGQFRTDKSLRPDDSLNGILFNNYLAPILNFSFNNAGMIFTYNPYEVASFIMGIFSIFIPFERLRKYIVSDFAKRMELTH